MVLQQAWDRLFEMAALDDKAQHSSVTNTALNSPNLSGDEMSREKDASPSHLEESTGPATQTTVTYTEGIDPEKERKLIRKIDRYVIPWVSHRPIFLGG